MPDKINTCLQSLKQKQYNAIIHSVEYKTLLDELSKRIIAKSKIAPNEATIENYFDCELFAFFRDVFVPLGFEYNPVKEVAVATKRHITKGRADSAIGALIIEFKQPSTLSNRSQQDKAVSQISDYLLGVPLDKELVGFVTDGTKGCFVLRNDAGIITEPFNRLSFDILDRLVQAIIKLRLIGLSSENLVNQFCMPPENTGIAFTLVKTLYINLSTHMTPKTKMLFEEWKELFSLSHDDLSKQQAIIDRKASLEGLLNTQFIQGSNDEYIALFALQTAYMIIVKVIAYRITSIVRYKETLIDFETLIEIDSEALRHHLVTLEDGAVFRDYGITNLLEGDFFSWYSTKEQWTADMAKDISRIFSILTLYSDKAVLNTGAKSTDFFKELYQGMIPSAVRHSLGEYYTKRWLAQQVVDEALNLTRIENWKGIDPCCGSGTFITVMIDKVLEETRGKNNKEQLLAVLSRVKGIDLNPVAVLTARVNYFINIAHLLTDQNEIEIPIYLGDSSYVPRKRIYDNVDCLEYTINTLASPIDILVPTSMVSDALEFSKAMTSIELYIHNLDENGVYTCLEKLVDVSDLTESIKRQIHKLADVLVDLERKNWNGIWARIITNHLTTANIGKFNIIVGNPPWVDWKSLPSGYRDRIASLCISRKLFSGDSITGGINLNICALILNVVAENYLSKDGVLGFLMPEPLIFQQSYEGFRNLYLSDDKRLYFRKFTNWTLSGHPFKPVTQKFLTYYISYKVVDYRNGVDVDWYVLKRRKNYDGHETLPMDEYFDVQKSIVATCHETKNFFSYVESKQQIQDFLSVAGQSYYLGREGIEFYPQEMTIFELSGLPSTRTCTSLKNVQFKKSKHPVMPTIELLETEYLYPLIKGIDITPFHIEYSGRIVPFPYDKRDTRLPISLSELTKCAPGLSAFYQKNKDLILAQTTYNERIIGRKGEFYALARVGAYSFADNYVVFRDNTKWGAAVISTVNTAWGGEKRPQFQNHAVSICEDIDGRFITYDEAHYICGVMNTPVAFEYVLKSSDSRSFPIRPRIYIPKYDSGNETHREISMLSQEAHREYNNDDELKRIMGRLNKLYLELAKKK